MERNRKILQLAKNKIKADENRLNSLEIPKFETTQGLDKTDINVLLSSKSVRFLFYINLHYN